MDLTDNFLTRLPPHIFQYLGSFLYVDDLLILEKSKLLPNVDGRSPLIQLCFDEMMYFKMVITKL